MRQIANRSVTVQSQAIRDAIRRSYSGPENAWLRNAPSRVERCATAWSLELDSGIASNSAVVFHARRSKGDPVTLKLVPRRRDFEGEHLALAAFEGRASVRLIAVDPAEHALLLERVLPGYSLRTLMKAEDDEAATKAASRVVADLHASQPAADPGGKLEPIGAEASATFERYLHRHGSDSAAPISSRQIRKTADLISELRDSEDKVVILHGDLHHDNVLRGESAPWLAIDPKGREGDPAAELAAFIRNPIDELAQTPDLATFLRRRIDQLVEELGHDRARVTGWATGLAVVAACWQLEDHESGWNHWLAVADALA